MEEPIVSVQLLPSSFCLEQLKNYMMQTDWVVLPWNKNLSGMKRDLRRNCDEIVEFGGQVEIIVNFQPVPRTKNQKTKSKQPKQLKMSALVVRDKDNPDQETVIGAAYQLDTVVMMHGNEKKVQIPGIFMGP